jgi:integrase
VPREAVPRLYLDPERRTWTIRHGSRSIRTGCRASERDQAKEKLDAYKASIWTAKPTPSPALSDVLMAYLDHKPSESHCISNLSGFWGGKFAADVNAITCKKFAETRPPVAARRDLEVLRASLNHWHKHIHKLAEIPVVTLPAKPEPRTRALTRGEVARLLLGALGWESCKKGRKERWRRVAPPVPHLARFVLLGFYTGTRSGAILDLHWSWIDFERGVMRRRAPGEADNRTKRRPPVKLGRRILSHLRRWRRLDGKKDLPICHYEGAAVTKLRRSWSTAARRGAVKASPHDLRRTRATILMSRGGNPETIAQALGMTPEILRSTYTQYDPEWQSDIADVDR